MKWISRLIIYPLCFSTYPILMLLAHNIEEVSISVAVRPLIIAWLCTAAFWGIAALLLRDWRRSGMVTALLAILFFSYGHFYHTLRNASDVGFMLARHRYLIFAYLLLFGLGLWWILKRNRADPNQTRILNLVGLILLVFPVVQLVQHAWVEGRGEVVAESIGDPSTWLQPPEGQKLPDIYYIILDTYTRGDSMIEDYGFDNSPFLDALRENGFFVADCSRCNHCFTAGSLTSSLNMEYLPALEQELKASGVEGELWLLIKNNRVANLLTQLGYTTIAFDTGYEWSRLRDADLYLGVTTPNLFNQLLNPFELLLIENSAGLLLKDLYQKSHSERRQRIFETVDFDKYAFELYAKSQLYLLDTLPQLVSVPGPKWVFAHVLMPHVPRVFTPEGGIVDDPGFYSADGLGPINGEYEIRGYLNEVQFVNRRMLDIVTTIIERSPQPPIIVLQGDTGGKGRSRYKILNAYYLPGDTADLLYPTISPVNTFRLIFDAYFGGEFGLHPDETYTRRKPPTLIPETSAVCTK